MTTKVINRTKIGSAIAVIISLVTLFGIWAGWLANDAVADYRVSTLWAEKDNDPKEIASIKQQLSDMKTDVAVIKESTSWIKGYLKSTQQQQ